MVQHVHHVRTAHTAGSRLRPSYRNHGFLVHPRVRPPCFHPLSQWMALVDRFSRRASSRQRSRGQRTAAFVDAVVFRSVAARQNGSPRCSSCSRCTARTGSRQCRCGILNDIPSDGHAFRAARIRTVHTAIFAGCHSSLSFCSTSEKTHYRPDLAVRSAGLSHALHVVTHFITEVVPT